MRGFKGLSSILIVLIISLAVSGIFAAAFFWKNIDQDDLQEPKLETQKSIIKPNSAQTATPLSTSGQATLMPFYELTTPYLRERAYKSSLGPLEKVSENSQYTSYLTSYSSDGLKINGQLTIPKKDSGSINGTQDKQSRMTDEKWPAVVFVHGYIPPGQYKTLQNYSQYVDFLARNGLVVFKIDLRGHANSEGESGGAYFSSDYIIDTLNAVAALKSAEFVDPEKIGLWGHSMAGNVVFRAFVAKGNIPKVVIWAGAVYTYSDFNEYSISDNSYRFPPKDSERYKKRVALFEIYGAFDPNSSFWKMVPPTNYLDGVDGLVQVHHATNDNIVSIEYSRNLMRILDGTGIPHELYEYPSGGHNLTGSSFNQAMERTANFLKNH